MRRSPLLLLLPGLLQAQAPAVLGRLYYTTSTGRALTFRVVEAGPGRMSLAPETGDAGRVRAEVLARVGERNRLAPGAITMADPLPPAWNGGAPGSNLIQTADHTIFWRYAPEQVLPARFMAAGLTWELLTADLPPGRRF
ncbi:hypothetical protein [Geothrix sp. PMB-07]|uniref:hypothetical protein n=1 Tax=Geothrix sp. PMB-07 TaxID=3068640 RepID=UPI0027405814|nr:hypothetical protein [Geothrix sp. PMB-07]WLT31452.1 hypothetical protein Q9293_17215 [Geothrix sp. PMB-07]